MEMERKESRLKGMPAVFIGAVFCCALWGGAFPGVKTGYKLMGVGPADTGIQIIFAGIRFILAGFMAVIIGSLARGHFLKPLKKSSKKIFVLSLLQTFLQYFFFYIGLAHTSGVNGSILVSTNVFVSLLVAALIFKQEKMTLWKTIGCIIGFTGVVILNLDGGKFDSGFTFIGEGFMILSTVATSFSAVLIKKYSRDEDPFTLSSYQFIEGGLLLLITGLILESFIGKSNNNILNKLKVSGEIWHMVFILLILAFISAVAYSLWGELLKYNPVSKVTVFGFTIPVFGVLFSVIFLEEKKQHTVEALVISLFLIAVGTLMVQRPEEGWKKALKR